MDKLQKNILGNIYLLEDKLLKMQQAEIETVNYFSDGIYCREMRAPKGSIIVGKMHKFQHINIISKGSIAVATQFGAKIITAPATIISEPGIKRVGLVLEDVVWTTIHPNPTDENDLEKLEELFIAKTIADVPNIKEGICPGLLPQ